MSDERFEDDGVEYINSYNYALLDTYYEFDGERIIEWNKHSSNAEYTDFERITEILNIKQMRLESLMKHREEVGKLLDRIDEQQATIKQLESDKAIAEDYANIFEKENVKLRIENKKLKEENEQLRLELETHKHPLWSTREAEKKVNKLADSLADEVNKNGLLNEEINQLRIENMRLKKRW